MEEGKDEGQELSLESCGSLVINPYFKTAMVGVSDVLVNGQRVSNLFGARDEDWHDAKVKPIKSLHSMTKVQDFEPNVDSTLNVFLDKLQERFAMGGRPCDIADYLAYCKSKRPLVYR